MSLILEGYTLQKATIVRKKQSAYGEGAQETLYELIQCRFVNYGEASWDVAAGSEMITGKAQMWVEGALPKLRQGDLVLIEEEEKYTVVKINAPRDLDGRVDHTKVILA